MDYIDEANALLTGSQVIELGATREQIIETTDGQIFRTTGGVWIKLHTSFRSRLLRKLKGSKLAVFLCIGLHVDDRNESFPPIDKIAEETGYSEREIKDAVRELEDMGLIGVTREHRKPNIYTVNLMIAYGAGRPLGEVTAPKPENASNCTQDLRQTAPQVEPIKKNHIISSPKNGDEPNGKAKPVTIDLEETYSGNRALKHYPQLVFDCPFCGERKKVKAHHEITPCCSSPIIWKNNLLISKRLRARAADAKAAQRAADRQAQLAANPALAYVIEQTGDKITIQPEEVVKINFFVGKNGLPAFKDCVDFVIKQAGDKGKYERGIIKFLINLLPTWGNGKTHVAKAEAGIAKANRIYKLFDGELNVKVEDGVYAPIERFDADYAIGEAITVEGVIYIKQAEKVYEQKSV